LSGVITIITDIGEKGYYLGSVKGIMLKQFASANIIDITTQITPFSITEAVFVMQNSWMHFPEKTVHLVLVEDRTVTTRKILIAEHENHFFIAPDNGIFGLFFKEENLKIFEADKKEINPDNPLLPSKLLMAMIAGKIASGIPASDLGKLIIDLYKYSDVRPVITENSIRGSIVFIDGFHNAITDISADLFKRIGKNRDFRIIVKRKLSDDKNEDDSMIHKDYSDVAEGEKVFHFNSAGSIVISINKGKASGLLGISRQSIINIEFR
jgi:S-adenosyl-L-methionine hydrolase (adenosine-forming)